MSDLAIDVRDLTFSYGKGPRVLDIPELQLPRGARTFLFGPSGSGKTTLLGLISGVLPAQSGRVEVLGRNLVGMRGPERDAFRAANVGYVFQMFNLIPYPVGSGEHPASVSYEPRADGTAGRHRPERYRARPRRPPRDRPRP